MDLYTRPEPFAQMIADAPVIYSPGINATVEVLRQKDAEGKIAEYMLTLHAAGLGEKLTRSDLVALTRHLDDVYYRARRELLETMTASEAITWLELTDGDDRRDVMNRLRVIARELGYDPEIPAEGTWCASEGNVRAEEHGVIEFVLAHV